MHLPLDGGLGEGSYEVGIGPGVKDAMMHFPRGFKWHNRMHIQLYNTINPKLQKQEQGTSPVSLGMSKLGGSHLQNIQQHHGPEAMEPNPEVWPGETEHRHGGKL